MTEATEVDNSVQEPVTAPKSKGPRTRAKAAPRPVNVAVEGEKPNPSRSGGESVASLRAYGSRTIILEHNDGIPPTGLFVAVNGVGFNIVPGKEVSVPIPILEALNNAVQSRPVVEDGRIVGYQDGLRFSYRLTNL